jgi:hypothetical protein
MIPLVKSWEASGEDAAEGFETLWGKGLAQRLVHY